MYSCFFFFCCEFIDIDWVFWMLLFDPYHSLHNTNAESDTGHTITAKINPY